MKKFVLFISTVLLFTFCMPVYSQEADAAPAVTVLQAVVNDDISLLAEIIKDNVKIDEPDENGVTPLIYAVRNGSLMMTDILVQLGADPSVTDKEGLSAIDWAEIGEDSLDTSNTSFAKGQIMKKAMQKPVDMKVYQRILFDLDNDSIAVLNCDDLIESRELTFCQDKIGEKITWEIYTQSGENIGLAQSVETVSHKGKEYFILKKWGEYSIILPSGIPLREHLKQVKYKIDTKTDKSGILVFYVTTNDGKKETFSPYTNIKNLKK